MYTQKHTMKNMASTTFTIRVDSAVKKRLEKLAKSTGRSRSYLAAEALSEYLDVNEWQIAGVKQAVASLDRGEGVPHNSVKEWVDSWGSENERSPPARFSKG
jgi:RHH-type transcriptional regulator, rel operon repressor / antitoxin RelB